MNTFRRIFFGCVCGAILWIGLGLALWVVFFR